ncbi:MAG: glycerol-3-phosphate 1-O-acyltransferase PlsY [Polyangiales bacterium]|nr:glycerol-3-phosphate 1-O-acyltransferase PlsY [Sandaracinus sp.]
MPSAWSASVWIGAASVLGAYLLGSVLFGVLAARRAGIDLRTIGSGNVGATNAERALGKRTGRVVMLLDALKGFLPTLGAHLGFGEESPWLVGVGVATALGHSFPVYYRFRGGKAAATSVGALLGAFWPAGLVAGVTFFVLKKVTRRASVGSLVGASAGLAVAATLGGDRAAQLAAALFALVVVRHHDNLLRLVRGEEPPS